MNSIELAGYLFLGAGLLALAETIELWFERRHSRKVRRIMDRVMWPSERVRRLRVRDIGRAPRSENMPWVKP